MTCPTLARHEDPGARRDADAAEDPQHVRPDAIPAAEPIEHDRRTEHEQRDQDTDHRAHLTGLNRSDKTIQAYTTDLTQFFTFLRENYLPGSAADVSRTQIGEYLTYLAQERALSGVTRARKLAAIREYFRFLVATDLLLMSPAEKVETPKQEHRPRNRLRRDEYDRLLSLAGSHPRDFAILTVFLQYGLRVSELCSLAVGDIDLTARTLTVQDGKGQVARMIALEAKAIKALKTYLTARGEPLSPALFLTRYGEPMSRIAIWKLVTKLARAAGIEKTVSPHIFRHTFASVKAERGVSPYLLRDVLGHKDIKTTQIYVHMSDEYKRKVMEATSL